MFFRSETYLLIRITNSVKFSFNDGSKFLVHVQNYMHTRETPAFGGICLALWRNGSQGAAFRVPSAPRLGRLRHRI